MLTLQSALTLQCLVVTKRSHILKFWWRILLDQNFWNYLFLLLNCGAWPFLDPLTDLQEFIFFTTEAVARRWSVKTMFLKFSQNFQENTCARVRPETCNFIKKRLWYMCFLLNFVKLLCTAFFYRKPQATAFVTTIIKS